MNTITTLSALTLGIAIAGYAVAAPFGGCDTEVRKQVLLAKYDTVEPIGTITLDEVQAVRLAKFQAMDTDANGSITTAERDAYRTAQKQTHFTEADTNADGQLSAEEFQQARPPHLPEGVELPANHAEKHAAAFSRIDSDANGFVTLEELEAKPQRHGRGGQGGCDGRLDNDSNGEISQAEFLANIRLFDHMDTNEDGVITEAEMDSASCERGGHRGGSSKGGHRGEGFGNFQR
ncbi:hypothetical protein [Candidatus Albibeggiatoa sp. nov. BB20]|uniref:EF-hand domain-containing protein n=1 Tax=Candidatus Albibeggiatoa sp. nov. BB20 TaxID=3162723 RepID=UPI003365AC2C